MERSVNNSDKRKEKNMAGVVTRLDERIEALIGMLGGSNNEQILKELTVLYKLRLEETKIEYDYDVKLDQIRSNEEIHSADVADREKSREVESSDKKVKVESDERMHAVDADIRKKQIMLESEDRKRKIAEDGHMHAVDADIRERQIEFEHEDRKSETDVKREAMEEERKERKFERAQQKRENIRKDILALCEVAVAVGVPLMRLAAFDRWYASGLTFEQTGVVSSPWVKQLISTATPKL